MVDRAFIASALRRMGLVAGDRVVVHSSLSRIGHVEGGAETVVAAFLDVLGPDGLLAVPAFSFGGQDVADRSSPVLTGAIPQAVVNHPDAVRSCSPTHSVAAIGRDAELICSDHHLRNAFAADTPLDRIAAVGGYILMLGVTNTTNSTVHVAETHAGVPYLHLPYSADAAESFSVRLRDGSLTQVHYTEYAGCSVAFSAIEAPLRLGAKIGDFRLSGAQVQLMRGQDVIDTVVQMLAQRADWLLCTNPECYACSHRRRLLREEGLV